LDKGNGKGDQSLTGKQHMVPDSATPSGKLLSATNGYVKSNERLMEP